MTPMSWENITHPPELRKRVIPLSWENINSL